MTSAGVAQSGPSRLKHPGFLAFARAFLAIDLHPISSWALLDMAGMMPFNTPVMNELGPGAAPLRGPQRLR
jgi:hypothetical protein